MDTTKWPRAARRRTAARRLASGLTLTLAAAAGIVAGPPSGPAQADPGCQSVLLVFARGSDPQLNPWSNETAAFFTSVDAALGITPNTSNVVQLGDEDDDGHIDPTEYPAVPIWEWVGDPGYGGSVSIGTDELVAYLNARVARCPREAIVVAGYSQGADVVGWALQRTGYGALNSTTRSHLAYVALYGDPTFDSGNPYDRQANHVPWWVRGNSPGWYDQSGTPNPMNGLLGARSPYAPDDLRGRFGSWCDQYDDVCQGNLAHAVLTFGGSHTTTYAQYWIAQSVPEIAAATRTAVQRLAGGLPAGNPVGGVNSVAGDITSAPGGTPTYDGVIRISGTNGLGVNVRSTPNTSSTIIGNLAEGTVVHPDCYTHGQNVGGTTLWWKVNGGYYTSFYDTVPLEWQTSIEQHYGIQSCAAVADSDGDGTPDATDGCPHVYVAGNGGCPAKNDFSLDGKSDVLAFYRYDADMVNLWAWNGQNNLFTSGPYAPWTADTGWQGSRLIPAGTGDVNGDRLQDAAAFYAYDNGAMGLDLWFGNAQAGMDYRQGWYVSSGWLQDHLIPAGVGDFNGDGRADVAAFYRYDDMSVNLYVWYGRADLTLDGPHTVWTGTGWDGTRIIPVGVGDTDGDGHMDISTFYRHDGGMVDMNVWYGDGTGSFTLGRPWHVDTGWDASRFVPMGVADLNGDGKADTIAIYRHDGNYVDMRVWYGTASRVDAVDPGGPWSASGWDGSRIIPAGTGDFNGDGKMDVASFYRYDGQAVGLDIWYGDGTGNTAVTHAWYIDSAWEGARLIPPEKG